ncbi:MAG: heparinase II/III family protein [Hyphomonadaceae bacterium]|nr:heparinase II/III family protein [Clostridia bacterium]
MQFRKYFETIRHMRMHQIISRVRMRLITKKIPYSHAIVAPLNPKHIHFVVPKLDFSKAFLSRYHVEAIMQNKLTFLNETHTINPLENWCALKSTRLWQFNLHYFEYLYALGHAYHTSKDERYYQKAKQLITAWIAVNRDAKSDAWHPYTISLRLPCWMACFEMFEPCMRADKAFQNTLANAIVTQYDYLKKHLEKSLLGNHYLENLKALTITAIFLGSRQDFTKYLHTYVVALDKQLFADGMHEELSPMYHKIMLEGAIKVAYGATQFERKSHYALNRLIEKMLCAMVTLEDGLLRAPFFNDCAQAIAKPMQALLVTAKELLLLEGQAKASLPAAGYYIFKLPRTRATMVIDCGKIGVAHNPGHGHCDALSFELFIDGKPVLVNSGTLTYATGQKRVHYRSTSAHNTVMVGGTEQSECWGAFRVARRVKIGAVQFYNTANKRFFNGCITTYLNKKHTRTITWQGEKACTVTDNVDDAVPSLSYLHVHPSYTVKQQGDYFVVSNQTQRILKIKPYNVAEMFVEERYYSEVFNIEQQNKCIVCKSNCGKVSFGYSIEIV